jgi:hypothetical protein
MKTNRSKLLHVEELQYLYSTENRLVKSVRSRRALPSIPLHSCFPKLNNEVMSRRLDRTSATRSRSFCQVLGRSHIPFLGHYPCLRGLVVTGTAPNGSSKNLYCLRKLPPWIGSTRSSACQSEGHAMLLPDQNPHAKFNSAMEYFVETCKSKPYRSLR